MKILFSAYQFISIGLKKVLESETDMELFFSNSVEESLKVLKEKEIDVVVFYFDLEIRIIEKLRRNFPLLKIIILSMRHENLSILALKVGVSGFLKYKAEPDEIIDAIRKVYSGGRVIAESMNEITFNRLNNESNVNSYDNLSCRELEIFHYLINGKTNNEIGNLIFISPKTVGAYKSRILRKLNLPQGSKAVQLVHFYNKINVSSVVV